jgi:hypothetical protein
MAFPHGSLRLTEAPGIQRLGYLQQKLPLSLHTMQILEGPETFVCSVLHTAWRDWREVPDLLQIFRF